MECVECVCVCFGVAYDGIGFGLYQSCGNRGSVGRVGDVVGDWVGGLKQCLEEWGGAIYV